MNLRRILLLFLTLVSLQSCSIITGSTKVRYKVRGKTIITMRIPKGYTRKIIVGGPSEYFQYQYRYPDSSMLYVTDELVGNPNAAQMKEAGYSNKVFSVYFEEQSDALPVEGLDSTGKYWKNQFADRYSIGFMKVGYSKKNAYDKAVRKYHIRKRRLGMKAP